MRLARRMACSLGVEQRRAHSAMRPFIRHHCLSNLSGFCGASRAYQGATFWADDFRLWKGIALRSAPNSRCEAVQPRAGNAGLMDPYPAGMAAYPPEGPLT